MLPGLYVDDERPLPKDKQSAGWILAKNFHSAITLLENHKFEELSLDHDISSFYGYREMTGYDIIKWLVQRKKDGLYVPNKIYVHSANSVRFTNMTEMIKRYLND